MSVCAKCQDPLVFEVNDHSDSDEENTSMDATQRTVADDVTLSCGDHFHWQCLIDSFETSQCPKCKRDITSSPPGGSSSSSSKPQLLVSINNEGGLQENEDIFPILQEEAYIRAHPEDVKSRAFLEFCREGDHRAIADLLNSNDEDLEDMAGPAKSPAEILRYQDPIGGMQSGLHAAAANGHREVAFLLLLLASEMPEQDFPALVFQEAAAMGIMREDQTGLVDIRSLQDAQGRTAEDVAKQEGGAVWHGWAGKGWLSMP